MPLKTIGRIQGYSAAPVIPRYSHLVWDFIKDRFDEKDPNWLYLYNSLKGYHRPPVTVLGLYRALAKYDDPVPTSARGLPAYQQALDYARRRYVPQVNKIPLRRIEDVDPKEFPTDTNPGYPYFLEGYRTKKDAFEVARRDAQNMRDRLLASQPCTFPPSLAFGRTKVVPKGEDKTRLVWGISLRTLLLERQFSAGLWQLQLTGVTPASYDITPFHGGYRHLSNMIDAHGWPSTSAPWINTDFSRYDTGSAPWIILDCARILEESLDFEHFDDGTRVENPEAYRRMYHRIINDLIHHRIIMPDGYIYEKHQGHNTGSNLFQLLQNVQTTVILQTLYALQNPGKFSPCIKVLGDDAIFKVRLGDKFDMDLAERLCPEIFGIKLNSDKTNVITSITDVTFLGRNLHGLHASRTSAPMLLSIIYPEQPEDNWVFLAQRLISTYLEDMGTNNCLIWFVEHLWDRIPLFLRQKMEVGELQAEWSKQMVKKFQRLGLKKMPELKLPTPFQLYYLSQISLPNDKSSMSETFSYAYV